MKIGVLAIQGAISEHYKLLTMCGVEAVPVKNTEDLTAVSGLIIPGGESTTIGKLIEVAGLNLPIKKRAENKTLALFGTCAGMVLMAKDVLDGIDDQPILGLMDTRVKRNAFGRQKESFETNFNFKGIEGSLTGVFIRAPLIKRAGEDVEILASLDEGIIAARQENLLAVSFHPELTEDQRVHQYFVEICEGIEDKV